MATNLPPELMMLLQGMGGAGGPGGMPQSGPGTMPGSPAPTGAPLPPAMPQGGSEGLPSGVSSGAIERRLNGGGNPAPELNGGMPMTPGAPPPGGEAGGLPTDPAAIIQLLLQMGAQPGPGQ